MEAKWIAIAKWTAIGALLMGLASQSSTERAPTTEQDLGPFLYRFHCAGCHGEHGKGDGPVAELLEVEPVDLTSLSKRPEGVDETWLATVIDGRERIRAHGTSRMPVWGMTFALELDREDDIQHRIKTLAKYVMTLQEDGR